MSDPIGETGNKTFVDLSVQPITNSLARKPDWRPLAFSFSRVQKSFMHAAIFRKTFAMSIHLSVCYKYIERSTGRSILRQ